jgi:hypothetical protein
VFGLVVGAGLFALVWRWIRSRREALPKPEPAPEPEPGPAVEPVEKPAPAPLSGRLERNPFRDSHPENDGSFPADSPDLPNPDAEPVESDAGAGDNTGEDEEDEGNVS